jgi:hypothetical protein
MDSLEVVLEGLSPLVVPTRLEYNVQVYPQDSPIEYPTGDPPGQNQIDVIKCDVSDQDGLAYQDFESTLPNVGDKDLHIQRIETTAATTRVLLNDDEVPANRDQNTQLYRRSERVEQNHTYDPLTFDIELLRNYDEEGVESDTVLYVNITTKTDIWFQHSLGGRKNANRLSAALHNISNALEPVRIVRESNRYTENDLSQIL